MMAPCLPVKPLCRQTSKKPSIFSLTPPIACTSPIWLTEPVTAKHCRIGTSESADIKREEFGGRRAVAFDAAIALLEDEACRQRRRLVERIARGKEA